MTSFNQNNPAAAINAKKDKNGRLPFDFLFTLAVMMLLVIGVLMLFSAGFAASLSKTGDSYFFIRRQVIFAVAGVIVMIIVSAVPMKFYVKLIPVFYIVCVILLVLVLFISKDSEKRWIYIGSFQFQPSEFAKLASILMLAVYISKNKDSMKSFTKGFLFPALIFGIPTFLVLIETHLSGAILIFSVGFVMILVGGCSLIWASGSVILASIIGVIVVLNENYMMQRIAVWLDPKKDILGHGHQPYQSLLTIGSGGLFGLGYGKSRQKYLFLPEPQNDCIFSIAAEEVGFVGVILIIILFAFLIWRGIYIAMKAKDMFSSLVVLGIIARVAIQTILNLAVVTNLVPTTGISLPFFSYGGTALLVLLAEMGIVLQISRDAYLRK